HKRVVRTWRDSQHLHAASGQIDDERGVERHETVHRPHLRREEIGTAIAPQCARRTVCHDVGRLGWQTVGFAVPRFAAGAGDSLRSDRRSPLAPGDPASRSPREAATGGTKGRSRAAAYITETVRVVAILRDPELGPYGP